MLVLIHKVCNHLKTFINLYGVNSMSSFVLQHIVPLPKYFAKFSVTLVHTAFLRPYYFPDSF